MRGSRKTIRSAGLYCLRTTSQSEALHKQLYQVLNIKPEPIGKSKTIIDSKNP
jgi:hypothetical protein